MGHSLGRLVALALALALAKEGHTRPSKLVLVAAMGLGSEMSRSHRLACHARLPFLGWSGLSGRSAALEAELVRTRGGEAPPSRAVAALVPLRGPVYDLSASLARIEAETLQVWGEQDPAIPVEVAREAASRLPNGRLLIEPGLGHAPHLKDEARVVPQIVSFLG